MALGIVRIIFKTNFTACVALLHHVINGEQFFDFGQTVIQICRLFLGQTARELFGISFIDLIGVGVFVI